MRRRKSKLVSGQAHSGTVNGQLITNPLPGHGPVGNGQIPGNREHGAGRRNLQQVVAVGHGKRRYGITKVVSSFGIVAGVGFTVKR